MSLNLDTSILRPYQVPHTLALARALVGYKAALDASDTGTGKTVCALTIAKALDIVPLVICPRSLIPTWEAWAERLGWGVEAVNYEKVRYVGKADAAGHRSGEYGTEVPHGKGFYWKWRDNYQMAIFDEVHRCGGGSTLNAKLLKSAKRQFGHLLCLSATAAESPMQLGALGFVLGLHDGRNFWKWVLRYGCKPSWAGGMEFAGDTPEGQLAMKKLHDQIFPRRGARMQKRLIPSFPRTQVDFLPLASDAKVDALTKKMAEAGPDYKEVWVHTMQELELLAVDQIVDLATVQRETSRVAIFVNFTETLNELLKKLPGLTGFVNGSQIGASGLRQRQEFVTDFQNNQLDFIIVNTQAGCEGLSLHDPTGKEDRTADILCNFSGRTLAQVLGRVHRDGGAFSQQFLLGYKGTFQEAAMKSALTKLDKISLLNDRTLFNLS